LDSNGIKCVYIFKALNSEISKKPQLIGKIKFAACDHEYLANILTYLIFYEELEHAIQSRLKSKNINCPVPVLVKNKSNSTFFYLNNQKQVFLKDCTSIENNFDKLNANENYYIVRLMGELTFDKNSRCDILPYIYMYTHIFNLRIC
jgi:hypothetical protein